MLDAWKAKIDKKIRRLKWNYKILRIKWVLLFVLPILAIFIAYQAAKQYLMLKMRDIGTNFQSEEAPGTGSSEDR